MMVGLTRRKQRGEPLATVMRDRMIYLNRGAYTLVGQPEAVRFTYDAAQQRIGLHPARRGEAGTYRVRANASGGAVVRGHQFLRAYGIVPDRTRRYAAALVNGALVIDLLGEVGGISGAAT
jgi:hypothetical protein